MIVATVGAGSVEYILEAAAINIEEFIAQLQETQADGATHVVGLSGNYRGAQYVRLGSVDLEEEEEE